MGGARELLCRVYVNVSKFSLCKKIRGKNLPTACIGEIGENFHVYSIHYSLIKIYKYLN